MKIEKNEFDGSVVTLDTYNSDLNLVIDGSRYSAHPLTDQGFAFMWAGARATHGVNKGKICYEVKVVKQLDVSHLPADEPNPHVIRVGFSVESSTLQLGEDPLSYGYGGTGKISTNCQFKNFGGSFGEGDCILAFLNMDADTIDIGFAKNGSFLGWAYKVSKNQLGNKALYPHILSKNTSFEVNFGQKDKPICNIPPGFDAYKFISCVPGDLREHGTQPPARREDCEMIMMCGLPGAGKSVWAADYSTKNPQKKFNVLGTNNIIDKMKVMGLPRKRNYHGRWDVLIQMATKCLNKEFEIGSKLCRNYVLDQTNVYPTAQRRKMRNFEGFQRSAVVVVPTEEEYKRRCDKRDKEEGKEIPDHAVLEMKANFKLPEVCDIFDKVMFTELQQNEAETLVRMYNEEGRAAIGPANKRFRPNDSSPRGRSFSNSGDYGGHQTYRGGRGGYDSGSYGRGSYSEQSQQGGYGSGSDQSSRGFGGNNYGRGGPQGRGGHSESGLSQDQGYSDSGYGQEGSSYTGYASERSYQSGGGRGGGSGRGGRGVGGRGSGGGNRGFGGDRGFGDSRGRGRGGGGDRGFGDSRGRGRGGGDRGSGNSRGFGGGRGGSGNRSGISSYSNEADDFNKGGYGGDSVLGSHGSESLLGSYGDGTSGGYGSGGSSSSYSGSGRPRSEGSFNKDMGYGSSGLDDYNQGSGYGSSGGNYNDGGNRSAGGNYNDGGNRSAGGNYDGGNRSSGGNYDGGNRSAGGNYDGGNRSSGGNYNDGGNRSAGGNYDDGGNRSAGGFNNDGKYGSGGSGFNKGGGYRGRGTGGRGAPRGGANHGFSTNQNNREGMSNQGNDSRNWTSSSSSQQSNITSDYQSTYGSTATEDNSASTGYGGYGQSYDNSYKPQSQGYQQYGYQSPTNPTPTAQTWAPTNPPPTAAPPQTAVQPQQSQWVSYSQQPPPQQQYYNQYYGQQGSTSTTGPVYGTGAYTPN